MRNDDLRQRTKQFALAIIRMAACLPRTTEAGVLGRQMLKAGTSPGAHYREAHRSRSDAEFVSKIEGGLQELDECAYWLELLDESGIAPHESVQPLAAETEQLIAIFVTLTKKAKSRSSAPRK